MLKFYVSKYVSEYVSKHVSNYVSKSISKSVPNLCYAQWMNTSIWAVSQAKVGKGRIRTADLWITRPKHYH